MTIQICHPELIVSTDPDSAFLECPKCRICYLTKEVEIIDNKARVRKW